MINIYTYYYIYFKYMILYIYMVGEFEIQAITNEISEKESDVNV